MLDGKRKPVQVNWLLVLRFTERYLQFGQCYAEAASRPKKDKLKLRFTYDVWIRLRSLVIRNDQVIRSPERGDRSQPAAVSAAVDLADILRWMDSAPKADLEAAMNAAVNRLTA